MATGLRILLTALLLCAPQFATAELLPDPTRPSIDLNSSGAAGAAEVVPDETVPRGLQSIIISPNYRAAIINGETVSLGGKYGDSRLVEVRENSVVLQNAQGRRVLELFPKVNIRKNEAAQHESGAQEKASGKTILPEQDVGGLK
jgi:MSHA biogenesis protein MshK